MSTKKIEHALPPGTELRNGVYSIERVIGSGGFGITYIGHKKPDTTFGDSKKVVIKELFIAPNTENYNCIRDTYSKKTVRPSESLQNNFEDFKRRFKEEAETLYKFREYEGMVQVLDYFEENGTFYFTMDYIESKDLNDVVKLRGKLSLDEALNYIRQVGALVHKIHQHKVLHRDIKPQNILIDKNGKAFLIDFGIAKMYNNLDVVSKVSGFHTPGYAPPEQFANKINLISEAMDVHALAATFFYCVTGKNPPTLQDRNLGEDVSVCHLNPELPMGIDPIIEKAMAIRPQDRTQTVKEFLDGLSKYGSLSIGTVTDPDPQTKPKPDPKPKLEPEKISSTTSTPHWLYYLISGIALAVAVMLGIRGCGGSADIDFIVYEEDNMYGYKDASGTIVIPARYETASPFSGGRGKVSVADSMYYIDERGSIVELIKPKVETPTEDPKPDDLSAKEKTAWQQAKSSNTKISYERYIRDYPDGNYVSEARSKIRDIEAAEQKQQEQASMSKPYIKMISIPGRNYKLSETEVTIGQYLAFCKATNSHWPEWLEKGNEYNIYTGSKDDYKKAGMSESNNNYPITGVSLINAIAFCKWMGGRIPTDIEWEYAAKGGENYKYAGSNNLDEVGWYDGNSGGTTKRVKQKRANRYGLYDMCGNVSEWTRNDGSARGLRGGDYETNSLNCKISNRMGAAPDTQSNDRGFRLAAYQ